MTLEALKNANRVIGIKQVAKAVKRGSAQAVFIAEDAEARVTEPLMALCEEKQVPVNKAVTMQELGTACGIEVGAAAAAVIGQ